ncbi:MAG: tetratricopeptide repeat protein, partial [bacterium]
DPKDHRLGLRYADLLARAGKKKTAIEQYKKVASVYIRDDFTPKAIAVYKTILRLNPEYLDAYQKLAELYKHQGLESEAISQLQHMFEHYEEKGDEDKQVEVLKLMTELDPENLGFQVRLGETMAKMGKKQDAAEAFAQAASTLSKRGFHDRASALFEKIIAMNPENIAVRKELCAHYLESGHFEEAKEEIVAILKMEPDDPRMVLLLGRILFRLDDPEGGEQMTGRSLELFLETGELEGVLREYLFVAQNHLRSGELGEAEAFYRQIKKAVPADERALKGLISVSDARRDRDSQVELTLTLGNTLAEKGDLAGAAEAFTQLLELDPGNEEAEAFLARDDIKGVMDQDLAEPLAADDEQEFQELASFGEELETEDLPDGELSEAMEIMDVEAIGEELDILPAPEGAEIDDDEMPEIVFETVEADYTEEEEPEAEEAMEDLAALPELGDMDITPLIESDEVESVEAEAEEISLETQEAVAETQVAEKEVSIDDLLVEANVYKRYGMNDKAVQILDPLIADYPEHAGVLEAMFDALCEASPEESIETGITLVNVLLEEGESDRAQTAFVRLKGIAPDDNAIEELASHFPDTIVTADLQAPVEAEVEKQPESADPFAEELEEAEFYLSQGLEDEALRIYSEIVEKSPGHKAASNGINNLRGDIPAAPETKAPPSPPEPPAGAKILEDDGPFTGVKSKLTVEDSVPDVDDFLDLAEELRIELADELGDDTEPAPASEGPVTFEEIFDQFKKGIAETLGEGEYETHYNLGIAYKEMGLYDDAIREFELASRDTNHLLDSLSLTAMCFVEKQDYDSAVDALQTALDSAGEKNLSGLHYQLGQVRERQKDLDLALESYEEVKGLDPSFENINGDVERVRELMSSDEIKPAAAPDAGSAALDGMLDDLIKEVEDMAREEEGIRDEVGKSTKKGKKDRISYI